MARSDRRYGRLLGGVPLNVDALDIDICYTGSQKCLAARPAAGRSRWPARRRQARGRKTPVANWYLDLTLLRQYWSEARVYHHTAPISSTYAL